MAKRPASSLEAGEVLSQSDQASSKRPRQDESEPPKDGQPRPIQPNSSESMPSLTDFVPWKSSEISSQLPPLPQVKDPELEKRAFTHPGVPRNGEESYERLEWLGDAYIELAATGLIFKTFPKTPAGRCSQLRELLVRNTTLAGYFREYNMSSKAILLRSFMADMFEAYFGAVVASDPQHGKAVALAWIRTLWGQTLKEKIVEYETKHGASAGASAVASAPASKATPAPSDANAKLNPKDRLRVAIGAKGVLISYLDIPGNKKDKNNGLPLYTVGVYLDGWGENKKLLGTGTALQKKEAGHKAAAQALENKKLMRVYETKKKAFQEALAAAQESETPRP